MRFKTLVLIPLVALLGVLAVKANASTLPTSQIQTSANAPQVSDAKLDNIEEYLSSRNSDVASRSLSRLPYASKAYNQKYAQILMNDKYGWSGKQYKCLVKLWNRESGWRVSAHNPSGAHGIPQALPGHKMSSAGPNWRSNPHTQIKWGLKYIKGRYGSPCSALGHSNSHNWY